MTNRPAGRLFGINDDGNVFDIDDLEALGDEFDGQLVYRLDETGDVLGINGDGELYELPDDFGDDDDDEDDDEEFGENDPNEALLLMFLDQTGDLGEAVKLHNAYLTKFEGVHGNAAEVEDSNPWPSEDQFQDFLLENPTAKADPSTFLKHVTAAGGDLDAAMRTYDRSLDFKVKAAEDLGYQVGPKLSTDQAIEAAFAPGGELHQRPEAKPYEPKGYDTGMDAAMGDLMTGINRDNVDREFARAEIKRMQRGGQ